MASFSAETIVEALDYTLEPYVPGCKGTVREPTSAQVRAFVIAGQEEVKLLTGEIPEDVADVSPMTAILNEMGLRGKALTPEAIGRQAKMISDLCSGHPTKAELLKLPFRIMAKFGEWISNEVMNPEAAAGAGNGQVIHLPSSAAG